jgi:hypothetical protein
MRRRKPWVLARRRLLGWNVRLLTRLLPDGIGGACLSCRGHGRRAQAPRNDGQEGGHAAAAIDDATGQRYGRPGSAVKPGGFPGDRSRVASTRHRGTSGRVSRVRRAGPADPVVPVREKIPVRVVDNRLLRGPHVVSVSPRRTAQPDFPRGHRPCISPDRQSRCGMGNRDITGQPMYTGCGRPCGRHVRGIAGARRADRTREG